MRKRIVFAGIYCAVLCGFLFAVCLCGKAVTTFSENQPLQRQYCVIIDAGHGGVDGGAVSCTGVYESKINLEIALRLNDLMHLLGMETKMIRTEDVSIYTYGESIAAKKASDLKERVKIVNETENGILLSIHQNYFSDGRYSGAQMFYAPASQSRELAQILQATWAQKLDPSNNRHIKRAPEIYLMKHITRPGVLIECGFLSNPEEESKLRDPAYQKKMCCVIASVCSEYFASIATIS